MDYIKKAKIDGVRKLDRFSSQNSGSSRYGAGARGVLGTLFLTPTHLIFTDTDGKRDSWILHSHLGTIEKLATCTGGTPLHLRCKNFRCVTFVIPKEKDAHDIYVSLIQISQPTSINDLFCFQYSAFNEDLGHDKSIAWNKFDIRKEYMRMGLPNEDWSITDINVDYSLCDTYPRYLVVPCNENEQTLRESATFRSKSRIPVLTYRHNNGASICRSSQPLPGLYNTRCSADERLLRSILGANQGSKCLYVVDTRPMINAMANKAAGKGYEDKTYYGNIKHHFYAIENIHVMRSSLQKLMDACELKVPSVNAFLSALEASGWLKHIKSVLDAALFIAISVRDGISVMVHCSDGWDRTAQTCSLASLILDPYYRTIDGFEALIEKEWLAFGHKFTQRCGFIQQSDPKQIAPVFTQFIDCVWQITQQFPFEFEFNEKFLQTLHDHVYSCQFGTFIGNCDKERSEWMLKENTFSLWALFDADKVEYVNPLYYRRQKAKNLLDFLDVNTCPQVIRFWRSMYNRFDVGIHPRESNEDLITVTYKHIQSLEEHIRFLQENIKAQEEKMKATAPTTRQNSSDLFQGNGDDELNKLSYLGDSFDSVDSPLRIVQECMMRLQAHHDARLAAEKEAAEQDGSDETSSSSLDKEEYNSTENISPVEKQSHENTKEETNEEEDYVKQIVSCMESVALDWQSLRNSKECHTCSYDFAESNVRFHCWACGLIFCIRCIKKKMVLPGHRLNENEPTSTTTTQQENSVAYESSDAFNDPLGVNPSSGNSNAKKISDNEKVAINESIKMEGRKVPVCLNCFKNITGNHSMDYNN
ncbi:myotubularin-related protein 6 isoform X2 [Tetranychus urticae]|uniref:myotubularin-related protein 6 isoform X2 n=1 Tax=Tetranychus urticae TaxID=32264 RepID=UPI000D6434D6|nr:myotubularin-related protein 6 isoform X2 [Tetranychus urticae]